jgi:predicted dehydrogenase
VARPPSDTRANTQFAFGRIVQEIALRPEDYHPTPPPPEIRERYSIASVDCGSIARYAHLPAYRKFGYRLVASCDLVEENARAAAAAFDIPFWTTDLDAVLGRPDVDVIDLADHAAQRLPFVERIAAAGKHILSQKPFVLTYAEAERTMAICREAGVTLMVNQQARWAPAHRALKVLLERGVLGHLYNVFQMNRAFQDVPGSWYVTLENFTIVDHGIHYVDLSRYFTGLTPVRVKATTTMVPGQLAVTPMIYSILCEYPAEAR